VVRLKREMTAVSAQDEFARWAKLRRTHDKAVADYEKSSTSRLYYQFALEDGI
jgi:ferric-dicitrate binding protein FerR (iron transport regulator)